MEKETEQKIQEVVNSKNIAIFMKGSPDFPQCGFSAQAVQALKYAGAKEEELAFFDVLEDNHIREGIKEYTNWPTIPQIFIRGEFIGGGDIVVQMAQKGELQKTLDA